MAIVNALKFNDYSGAIIADEEYWMQRRRRSYFRNSLQPLLNEEISNQLNMVAVYGGFGNPSFDYEVVTKTQNRLLELFAKSSTGKKTGSKTPGFATVEDIGIILLEIIQETSRRRTENKLKYLYGFGIHDFNRGYFQRNNEKIEIKQNTVKKSALKIIEGKHKLPFEQPLSESRGVLIGYDPTNGFSSFYLNMEKSVLSYTSGGFEAIGTGKYAAGIALGKFLNNRTYEQRMHGFDRAEGLVELIISAIATQDHYHEVGGYFNFIYVNGQGKNYLDRMLKVFDHKAHLATEIVRGYQAQLIPRESAFDLVDRLVYRSESFDKIETLMFKTSTDPVKLEKVLRGYKLCYPNGAVKPTPTRKSSKKTGVPRTNK